MTDGRPNVVVFLTDQQRWDTTGVGGNPLGLTPNFDRLARTGTHAPVAITPNPLCAPARAALQTGMIPTATGCYRNKLTLPPDKPTIADCFNEAGYATGYIGKWHLGDPGSIGPVAPAERGGYTSWLASNVLEFTSDDYRTVVYDDDGDPVRLPGYRADALTDAAIRYVSDQHDRPFFLFLSFLEPHQQNEVDAYLAPDGYAEEYAGRWMPPDLASLGGGTKVHEQMGGYLGQVKRLDECLGRLRDALRSLGVLDNTIIAVTSDHGCHFGTRSGALYKQTCHDASMRVPLALSGPGFAGRGAIDRPVSTVDLPVTLLDAAGVSAPDTMQGRSLLAAMGGADDGVLFQVSGPEVGRGLRTRRWKYYVVAPDADGWNDSGADRYVESALFDLDHDPYELANLIGQESVTAVTGSLRAMLTEHMLAAGEPKPTIDPAAIERSGRPVDRRVFGLDATNARFGHQPKATGSRESSTTTPPDRSE